MMESIIDAKNKVKVHLMTDDIAGGNLQAGRAHMYTNICLNFLLIL